MHMGTRLLVFGGKESRESMADILKQPDLMDMERQVEGAMDSMGKCM
jgi:hypothetical protein